MPVINTVCSNRFTRVEYFFITPSVTSSGDDHGIPCSSALPNTRGTVFLEHDTLCAMFRSLNPNLFRLRISRYLVIFVTSFNIFAPFDDRCIVPDFRKKWLYCDWNCDFVQPVTYAPSSTYRRLVWRWNIYPFRIFCVVTSSYQKSLGMSTFSHIFRNLWNIIPYQNSLAIPRNSWLTPWQWLYYHNSTVLS